MAQIAHTPQPVYRPRPTHRPQGNSTMFAMMQIIAQLTQIMMSQFQWGGGIAQPYSPIGTPGGYGPQTPSPFNYFGGSNSSFFV